MPNYQLKLTPIDSFFFGNEKHIDTADNGDAIANYFVESYQYPQQTTILGALRFFILKEAKPDVFNNNKIVDKGKAEALIGLRSFDLELSEQSFGEIESLSAVYFLNKNKPYFFAPMDYESTLDADLTLRKEIEGETVLYTSKNHNKFINQSLLSESGERILLNEVVKDKIHVGNNKNATNDAYYKQNSKYLADEWAFAVNISLKNNLNNLNTFITLGGEKSVFKAEFVPINNPEALLQVPKFNRPLPYIFCLSDCLISPSEFSKVTFGVTKSVSFRNLHSIVKETNNYSSLTTLNGKGKLRKGARYNLLMRGSILYFSDIETLDQVSSSLLQNSNAFRIGFNQFISKK